MKKTIAPIIAFGFSLLEGLYIMLMWRWFVTPLGVIEIGYWHGIGLSLLSPLLIGRSAKNYDDDDKLIEAVLAAGITTSIIFGVAAIVHALM